MDGSPPGSSVQGILQARALEWAAISFSRGSSQPRSPAYKANSLPSEIAFLTNSIEATGHQCAKKLTST